MVSEIACKHYKGEGYIYKLNKELLLLCETCNKELTKAILEQVKLEESLKK